MTDVTKIIIIIIIIMNNVTNEGKTGKAEHTCLYETLTVLQFLYLNFLLLPRGSLVRRSFT